MILWDSLSSIYNRGPLHVWPKFNHMFSFIFTTFFIVFFSFQCFFIRFQPLYILVYRSKSKIKYVHIYFVYMYYSFLSLNDNNIETNIIFYIFIAKQWLANIEEKTFKCWGSIYQLAAAAATKTNTSFS